MRPKSLARLFESLSHQNYGEYEVSFLVVDNDDKGDAKEALKGFDLPINIVTEPQRGIPYARNRAVKEFLQTKSDALIFVDDDETVGDDWFSSLIKTWGENKSDIVSGPSLICFDDERHPKWAETALNKRNHKNGETVDKFYTGNVLISRHVLEDMGDEPFDARFRYTGSSDLHFAVKANNKGYKAVWSANAITYEWTPSSRTKLSWFVKRGYRSGAGYSQSILYENKPPLSYFKSIYMGAGRIFYGLMLFCKALLTFDKGLMAKALNRVASGVGSFAGMIGLNYHEYKNIHGK